MSNDDGEVIKLLGFTIPDIVGLSLGFMAAVLALIAVFATVVIYFLGKRHSEHLKEVELARRALLDETAILQKRVMASADLISEVNLGFDLIRRLTALRSQLQGIESTRLSDREMKRRAAIEKERIEISIKAREIELLVLSSGGKNCSASLVGLASTYGDHDTVTFLRRLAQLLEARGNEVGRLWETLGTIQGRLNNS